MNLQERLRTHLKDYAAAVEAADRIDELEKQLAARSSAESGGEMREALTEIANRASNLADKDAAEWMPSIYAIACRAIGEDPVPLLKATGFDGHLSDWPTRAQPQTTSDELRNVRREKEITRLATIWECIDLIKNYEETIRETSDGTQRYLAPRHEGNLMGTAYIDQMQSMMRQERDKS